MKPKDVLIVEDDRGFAIVLALRCQQLGLTTRIARNATHAVTMMTDERPDLILLEIEMPLEPGTAKTRHGLVICEKLSQSVLSEISVIVLTAASNPGIARELRSLGADGFLMKPLDIPMVIAELSRFVRFPNL